MQKYPIFLPGKLQQAANNLLPGQVVEPPEQLVAGGEQKWKM